MFFKVVYNIDLISVEIPEMSMVIQGRKRKIAAGAKVLSFRDKCLRSICQFDLFSYTVEG